MRVVATLTTLARDGLDMNQQSTGGPEGTLTQHRPGPLSGQRKLFIAIAMLAMAVGYFAFIAFQGAAVFYLTVDELLAGDSEAGETVRVSGKLVPDSFQREATGTVARFSLAGGGQTLPAAYDGILPELFFNEHSDIVLEGYHDSEGVFQSRVIIVKCPSKYQALTGEGLTSEQQVL